MSQVDTIIIGAGIAGLAASIALRQRGIDSVILEQSPELREIGAGLLLGPNACAVLDRLGALVHLAGHSVPVDRWELRNWRGRLLSALHIPRSHESSLSTRRSDLQSALIRCLPADAVRLKCGVKSAALSHAGVRLDLADGGEIRAKRVIVADGAHSQVRNSLWPDREPRYCGYIGWRGLVDHVPAGWESGRVSESWGHGRRFGIAAVGGGRTYWYASANVPEARCRDRVHVSELCRIFAGWHEPVSEILQSMPEESLLQHPIMDRCPRGHWHLDEKIALIGDAAHPLTPNLGQGASMALEDAWELAARWSDTSAMGRYEESRGPRVMRLWALSRAIGKVIQWRNPLLCGLREIQMSAMPDALATFLMRRLLHYIPGEGEG